jgi:benzoate transport
MTYDPRQALANSAMSRAQIIVIAIVIACTALDGFDVLAISFAAPGIAQEWRIDRAALGIVLSMELVGMAIGAVLLGALADRVGRRNAILVCLVLMSLGMGCVTTAHTIAILCMWRILTGLGIGGMFAAANAIAAEVSNTRRRDLAVTLMTVGYPLGAIAGGSVAALLLRSHDWRSIFALGSAVTFVMIPVVSVWLPESVIWLYSRRPPRALARLNRSLSTLGYGEIDELPAAESLTAAERPRLLGAPFLRPTVLLTLVYTLHFITFYFLLKWVPKIVVDMGYPAAAAAGVLVWANVGTAIGGAGIGLLSLRFAIRPLTVALLLASAVMVWVFGHGQASLTQMSLICAITGVCTSGGGAGIYAVIARAFPAGIRASGTGFVIGFGRGGTVLAPVLAGLLFSYGYPLQLVAIVMGCGSLIAAGLLAILSPSVSQATPQPAVTQ